MSGNVWMFSDQIDDEDLEFMTHEFVTYSMACDYYRLGLKSVTRMAHEAGAIYKIGKKVLIRRSIFEAYLRQQRRGYVFSAGKTDGGDGRCSKKIKSCRSNNVG